MNLKWPLAGPVVVTRKFNFPSSIYYMGVHYGTDIVRGFIVGVGMFTRGATVVAPGDGRAMAVPHFDRYRGYYVIWEGPGGSRMHCAHLLSYIIPAGAWVNVKQGQALGLADNTGLSAGDHVHIDFGFPVKKSPEAVWKDPLKMWVHDVEKWIGKDLGWAADPAPPIMEGEMIERLAQNPDKNSPEYQSWWIFTADHRRNINDGEELHYYKDLVKVPVVILTQNEFYSVPWVLNNHDERMSAMANKAGIP